MTRRPTELSIGMAAEQLFEQLPKATRQQLRDLPAVVHRLEDDAQKMRRRLEELQEAGIGEGGVGKGATDETLSTRRDRIAADLEVEPNVLQQPLADAVAALETIRLNILRMPPGTGDVHALP